MMKNYMAFWFLLFTILITAQNVEPEHWKEDLQAVQDSLKKYDHLFKHISKNEFSKYSAQLETVRPHDRFWELKELLGRFKMVNVTIHKNSGQIAPFKVTCFNGKFYLTQIPKTLNYALGHQLLKINETSLEEITNKIEQLFYLPHQNNKVAFIEKHLNDFSFLNYLGIIKNGTLQLECKGSDNTLHEIVISLINDEEMVTIEPIKNPFNKRKEYTWFWMYGINYGQEVFLKYKVSCSREHISKLRDSLQLSEPTYARKYDVPLQQVYSAPELIPFINKVNDRFKNKRYKKLIIDLRDNYQGAYQNNKYLIEKITTNKRINKKGSLFILTNSQTNNASIATILALQKQVKPIIIGEPIFGVSEDIDNIRSFALPHSKYKITFPIHLQEEILVTPNILVNPTLDQYRKGIDALLQKALDY